MREAVYINRKEVMLNRKKWHLKLMYRWIIFIILSSLSFYIPVFIPEITLISKYLLYISVTFFLFYVSKRKTVGKRLYSKVIIAILLCQLASAYNAYIFLDQPLVVGIIATFQGFGFIVYLGLVKSKLTLRYAEKVIRLFGILFIIVSIIDRIYPLFGTWAMDTDRGGVRFRLLGLTWVVLCFLMAINKYLEGVNRKRNRLLAVFCFIAIVAAVTRQVIGVSLLLGGLLIFRRLSLYKKIVFSSILVFSFFVVLPKISVFQKLTDTTTKQVSANSHKADIRVVAFYYLTFEPRNVNQILFGMGIPSFGKSKYGNSFEYFSHSTGIYREDLGYSGFYYNHGLIALLLVIFLMLSSLRIPIPSDLQYLRYFMIAYILMNIASGQIEVNDCIIPFIYALFMLNVFRLELKKQISLPDENYISKKIK
jgi:membrane protein